MPHERRLKDEDKSKFTAYTEDASLSDCFPGKIGHASRATIEIR